MTQQTTGRRQEAVGNGTVQLWQHGIMITVIPRMEAVELIQTGTYREINDQAIEWINR